VGTNNKIANPTVAVYISLINDYYYKLIFFIYFGKYLSEKVSAGYKISIGTFFASLFGIKTLAVVFGGNYQNIYIL